MLTYRQFGNGNSAAYSHARVSYFKCITCENIEDDFSFGIVFELHNSQRNVLVVKHEYFYAK